MNPSAPVTMTAAQTNQVGENIEHAKTLFVLAIVGPVLAALLVANRLVFRFRITGGMGLDDHTITIATVRTMPEYRAKTKPQQ